MSIALVTGSSGLIGSESVRFFADKGFDVVGIDNDMRRYFFGEESSTQWMRDRLLAECKGFRHHSVDIRDVGALMEVFRPLAKDIAIVIHTAAQPSHDWAAKEPFTDFGVNANGTLNVLEATRQTCPEAAFLFTSTNKVYGDTPNALPLVELETRWELDPSHAWHAKGIDETMSIDHCKHSIFGASKVAADVMVQEYGKYFGMKTCVFRGGCLTGPQHSGAELHGFLAYLAKCAFTGREYRIFGYKGKQVRDNIHCSDLVSAIWHFFQDPCSGEAFNMGGSRHSNCSMLEAISICQELAGRPMRTEYKEDNRIGDHIWWISDVHKFKSRYPGWTLRHDVNDILREIFEYNRDRWVHGA
jgi:CDP-paratose 2-epimerase